MIKGSMIAIVTPMREDGSIDYDSYQKLIDWQVREGADAIVSMGTSGESPTVSFQEHTDVVKAAVEAVGGRVPVVAGTGANSTVEAVRLTQEARAVGADYSLQVVPYYNKPTQEGLFRHFSTVAKEGGLPVILYNVPSRTGRDMTNETVLRLAEVPGIAGLKDATGDLARAESLLAALPKDSGFALYSGNDDSALSLMLAGGQGVISVTANVAPRLMHEMAAAAIAGDVARAREINERLLPLHHELFCESNPIPIKWALWRMGRIPSGIRLPLTWLSEPGQKRVEKALAAAGLI
ncbi:4-hydroxy-tetrahydrodipicolinate synthase [Mesosutterella sp. OilRF-GAM-744-9]|uniref:4-hydroxy-tetrahydrodipicolinate synthase n=1 Tax=Mesosutterella porci TaxID=2915351 RepID=A0ABS9MQ99_9BURK|nr:4-hydroxy-tetrahydrodipicolinate synthase [Mesosutterella sp. oilRF-744-WT-GAM-9]MCG5030514.1 4-hydroxy-tetrahydrodipicolinate synthase [Mesosutterella sp. oilRF-744-WT-GAM-9]